MKSVIVGTAGHIDHGKTALVKALTGVDADRLEEEKRRGITIDIGFAHLELPSSNGEPLRLGFVDVPGHERFVRNMLAGIGGIDLVLLVIAADESIKPQTLEHFDICRLLSIQRGITVLTKSDLVDRETLDIVRLEVDDFVRGSFLEAAPIIAISSLTGAGLDDLKRELSQTASQVSARDSDALSRLPIDRVFTMRGFGTVVTGTLISGTIRKDDELEVLPGRQRVRVRGVQVHGQASEQTGAGQRTALNLVGADIETLARGMMLAPPATFQSTVRADASLSLLPSARPLRDRARVHLHANTSETIATIVLSERKQIAPGESAVAQLRLADPVQLLPGDHFIIRQFSPVITIGGGVVLDASATSKADRDTQQSFLKALATNDPASILEARISRRGEKGLTIEQAIAETGWRRELIDKHLNGTASIVRAGDLLMQSEILEHLKVRLLQMMTRFHSQNPLVSGMNKEALRETLQLSPEVFALALQQLVSSKKADIAGELVNLHGRGVVLKDEEAESKKLIEDAFLSAGLRVPALKDVLAGLKVDKNRAQKIVTLLLRDKTLLKISEDLVFHRHALEELRKAVIAEKSRSPRIDVAHFKDLAGVTRKYAIPLLEYLDREHVTKRVGDERLIL